MRFFGLNLPFGIPRFGINFVNGPWFEKQARKAFSECDIDKDGQLDYKEIYIALLKLYDLINRKCPYHIKVPSIDDVNHLLDKYDSNANRKFEFPEFLQCCQGLIGNKKDWRDSIALKIAIAVGLKALGFPYLAGFIKSGIQQLGLTQIQGIPVGAITYMLEASVKQIT